MIYNWAVARVPHLELANSIFCSHVGATGRMEGRGFLDEHVSGL